MKAYPISYRATAGGYGANIAQNALQRWLAQQKQSTATYTAAEEPLREAVQMFQTGGSYGEGQRALLRDEAKQAMAEAMTSQVASGMSSGSLATSTAMRAKSDLAKNLAGVEDVRTQFLTQALQALSGLRGQRAETLANLVDPTYAPYMSYLGQQEAIQAQEAANVLQANLARKQTYMQTEAQKEIARIQANAAASSGSTSSTNLYNFKY